MGIRITPHSWRSPLLLIDSWLPAPSWQRPRLKPHEASRPGAVPPSEPQPLLSPLLQRFARAGWLSRTGPAGAMPGPSRTVGEGATGRPAVLRMVRPAPQRPGHRARAALKNDGRLVIAGSIGDVCAELDRLVALEAARPAQGLQR